MAAFLLVTIPGEYLMHQNMPSWFLSQSFLLSLFPQILGNFTWQIFCKETVYRSSDMTLNEAGGVWAPCVWKGYMYIQNFSNLPTVVFFHICSMNFSFFITLAKVTMEHMSHTKRQNDFSLISSILPPLVSLVTSTYGPAAAQGYLWGFLRHCIWKRT